MDFMKKVLLISLLLIANSLSAQENLTLQQVIYQVEEIDRKYYSFEDYKTRYHFLTEDMLLARSKELQKQFDKLNQIPKEQLGRQDQITQSTLLLKLTDEISEVKYKSYLMPFNAEGGFYNATSLAIASWKFNSPEDFSNYQKWVLSYLDFLDYNKALLIKGIRKGIMRPKVIVGNALKLIKPYLVNDYQLNPFFAPYLKLNSENSEELKEAGRQLIEQHVRPKYEELEVFLRDQYLVAAPQEVGISKIQNGKAYYEDRIAYYTTQSMSPDSVYQLGLQEVARIRQSMDAIIADLEFDGSFKEFIGFLRTDAQFYAKTPQELLSRAAWLGKKAEGQLPKLFKQLYQLPFTVEPVPASIAPTYTGGRYVPGSRSDDRAGIYWVNTYDLPSRPFYTLPALTLHEAVPGHHLGMMVAAELAADIPEFRKNYYISAYGEGWGLYAEYLGEEMGMYETPYELFGRYTYEMWRACRLVVDVGIHYKGWSRQQALDYLANNTALSLHEVTTEIDRYIGWPGQAVSYKVGELTIKKLRETASLELGDKFDIQDFHQIILSNGSVPLFELQKEVRHYIEKNR